MSALDTPEMNQFVKDWRDSMESMLELPDDVLAEKLSILFDARRPVGERALSRLNDRWYKLSLSDSPLRHGEARGVAVAARIICTEAGYDEPSWVSRELDA